MLLICTDFFTARRNARKRNLYYGNLSVHLSVTLVIGIRTAKRIEPVFDTSIVDLPYTVL